MARVEAGLDAGTRAADARRTRLRGVAFGILAAGLAMLGWPIVSQGAAFADDFETITQTGSYGPMTVTVTNGSDPAQVGQCGPGGKGHVVKFASLSSSPASDSQATFGNGVGGRMSFSLLTVNNRRLIMINGLRKSATTYNAGTPIYASSITVLRGNTGKTFTFEQPVNNTVGDLGGNSPDSYWLDAGITNGAINQVIVCALDPSEQGVNNPDITITKTQTNAGPFVAGQTINYTITVTNSGTLLLAPFTITDPNAVIASCSFTTQNPAHGAGNDNNLANGYTTTLDPATNDLTGATTAADVVTCTASHLVTQAEVNASATYTNTATGSGSYRNIGNVNGATSTLTESASVQSPLNRTAAVSMTKTATTAGPFVLGNTITYTLVAKNTGTVTLTGVVITDPGATVSGCVTAQGASLVSGTFTMPPNSTVTCQATKVVTAGALTANDLVTNVATVNGNAPAGMGTVTASDDDTRSVLVNRLLTIEKTVTDVNGAEGTTTYSAVGDVINFAVVVTNAGDVALANVNVTDANVALACNPTVPVANLAVNGTITCTGSHVVTQADLDNGSYTNTAGAAYGTTAPVTDTVTALAEQAPAMSVEKSVTGVDGGLTDPFRYDSVGDTIRYAIAVSNTGNITLTEVVVADALVDDVDCDAAPGLQHTIASIAPGATVTCTASYTVTQADLDEGAVLNAASATSNETPEMPDEVVTPAESKAALGITKTQIGGPDPFDATGAVLEYEIVVSNVGNVTLLNVEVVDPGAVGLDCNGGAPGAPTSLATLAPGASVTCTASHTTTQVDLDDVGYFNDAIASADNAPQVTDTAFTPSSQTPALTVQKVLSDEKGTVYDSVGDVIGFEITATNTGNVTLAEVAVSDPAADTLVCDEATTLAPGEAITCTATHVVTQADLDAGEVVNVAEGTADLVPEPVSDEVTVPLTVNALATIDKVVVGGSPMTTVGESVTFTVVVTNAGNQTLSAVNISDPTATLDCPAGTTLPPGETITCTATHVVTQDDLDNGTYTNTATVDTDRTEPLSDSVEVPAVQTRSLTVVKTVESGAPYGTVGDAVAFTITVTNTGNVTLTDIEVSDANATGLDCNGDAPGAPTTLTLAPGQSIDCTASHVVTQDDIDKGGFTNVAIATVPEGPSGQGSVDVDADQQPAMTIDKIVANGSPYDAVGDDVVFTITVTNTGNTTLTGVAVTDPVADLLSCGEAEKAATSGFTLAPGAILTCTATHTVTQDDVDAGSITDTATASSDATESVSDTAVAEGIRDASLLLDKRIATTPTPPVGGYTVGTVITWTIEVTNNGNVSITDIHVTDDFADLGDCAASAEVVLQATASVALDAVLVDGTLAPGASFTCTATHTVTQDDVDAGRYTNLATVAGEAPGGDVEDPEDDIVASDDDTVFLPADPNITVTKTVTSSGPYVAGGTVAYSIVVTNNGTVALEDVTVEEQAGVTLGACTPAIPVDTLAVGATVTCTATHTVTNADLAAGTYRNVVTARGVVNRLETVVEASDTVDQAMAAADLAITNTMTTQNPVAGGNVTYQLVVTNNGPSTATDIEVLDPMPTGFTLVSAGGTGWTCTGTTTVRCTVPSAGVDAVSTNGVGLAPLASGASLPAITVVAFADAVLQGTTVTNTATVSGSRFDPVASNNTAPADVTFPAVLAEQVDQTTTTLVVLDTNLPRTGASGTGLLLQTGLVFTGAGAVLLLLSRRRRPVPGRPV